MTSTFRTSEIINYNLRTNEENFALQEPNTNYMKRGISYSGAALWNDLPKYTNERQISFGQFRIILNGKII